MKPPMAQSHKGTSQMPQAKLRALQGTTPTNRSTVKRTQIGVCFVWASLAFDDGEVGEVGSNNFSVSSTGAPSSSTLVLLLAEGDGAGVYVVPSNADLVKLMARGKTCAMTGARGLDSNELQRDPTVVKRVCKMVATSGFINAPAKTLSTAEPGTLQAFFQMDVTAKTAKMCAVP